MNRNRAIAFILVALVTAAALAAPLAVRAQASGQLIDDNSIWDRVYFGLALKTWIVIVALIVIVSVLLEGLGWIIALVVVGYVLWRLLS